MKRTTALLACAALVAFAVTAQEDPPSMPDLGQSAMDEVKAMDQTVQEAAKEVDNAAMRSATESSSGESHSESHSSSSSVEGSISLPIPTPGGNGEIVWPFGHHKHHQDQANSAAGVEIEAGPIWNDGDANQKCPSVCRKANLGWTGQWRTTQEGSMSVCSCANSGQGQPTAIGPGGSCSAPANFQCRGCSVSCPAGKQAHCTTGDRGIFTGPSDGICQTDAKCECSD